MKRNNYKLLYELYANSNQIYLKNMRAKQRTDCQTRLIHIKSFTQCTKTGTIQYI